MAGYKGTTFSADILKLIFQAAAIANIADNAATSPLTQLFVSLHTADPTAGGNQTSNEAAYTGYARVAVARTSGGFSISGSTITPVADVTFPAATGGSETETWFGIGTASSGAGKLLYAGPLTPTQAVSNGTVPIVTSASTVTEG